MGQIETRLGNRSAARQSFEHALQINGASAEALSGLIGVDIDDNRGADAVKTLQQARAKFPSETSIPFELGAVFEKQKRFSDAEQAFRQVLAIDASHAPALNYLGYMLADRGERLAGGGAGGRLDGHRRHRAGAHGGGHR